MTLATMQQGTAKLCGQRPPIARNAPDKQRARETRCFDCDGFQSLHGKARNDGCRQALRPFGREIAPEGPTGFSLETLCRLDLDIRIQAVGHDRFGGLKDRRDALAAKFRVEP